MAQMNTKFLKIVFSSAIVLGSFVGVQSAHALTHPGMAQFCASYSSQCRIEQTDRVQATDKLMAMLQQVNSRVNASIRAVADRPGVDRWSLNPSSGDCEDFALSKRAALIRAGVPAGVLRIAVTKTRRGEPHAVLVVKTSQGDYVLDNLRERVTTLGGAGYRIQFMSTQDPRVFTRAG
jgi:predicted transglutaminase-like cysteine proteinase